jgi:hypothetical protein
MAAKRDFTDRFLKSIKPAALGRRLIFWDAHPGKHKSCAASHWRLPCNVFG